WNLAQRRLAYNGDQWLVDGRLLRFFHFSGITPEDLTRLSKYTTAFQGEDILPPLRALMCHYVAQLMANGYGTVPRALYAYDRFGSGVPIPKIVRQIFRERHLVWAGDPFETYEEYLHLPVAEPWAGPSGYLITNLMSGLHQRQPWLSAAFDPARQESAD